MIVNEEVSLQAACDWLEYTTDRSISTPGLKKHIDKKYGTRNEDWEINPHLYLQDDEGNFVLKDGTPRKKQVDHKPQPRKLSKLLVLP